MEILAERPHRLFANEVVFDLILSSLEAGSQLPARLVCQQWNDRILANFCKTLTLRLKGFEDPAAVRKKIRDLDPRIISSLRFYDGEVDGTDWWNPRGLSQVFRSVMQSWVVGHLRSLHLGGVDKKGLDCLIKIANKGLLSNLKELKIQTRCCSCWAFELPKVTKVVCVTRSIAFPNLTYLSLKPSMAGCCMWKGDPIMKLHFEACGFPETFKSFATSAPNLLFLETNFTFKESELKKLKILQVKQSPNLFRVTEEEGMTIVESVRHCIESLTLSCYEYFPTIRSRTFQFPLLRNLTFLEVQNYTFGQLIDWTCFPSLRMLKIELPRFLPIEEIDCFDGSDYYGFLPLPDCVKEVWMTGIGFQEYLEEESDTLGPILNSKVSRLVIRMKVNEEIAELFKLLRLAEMDLQVKEKKEIRILEFHYLQDREFKTSEPVADFSNIMEKLRRNWDLVRFKDFKNSKPRWTEVTLLGDKKEFACPAFLREPCDYDPSFL